MKFEQFYTEAVEALDAMAEEFNPDSQAEPCDWLAELIRSLGYDDGVVSDFINALDY